MKIINALACATLLCGNLMAAETAAKIDVEKAKDIYGPCAACHGEFGAGGKKESTRAWPASMRVTCTSS